MRHSVASMSQSTSGTSFSPPMVETVTSASSGKHCSTLRNPSPQGMMVHPSRGLVFITILWPGSESTSRSGSHGITPGLSAKSGSSLPSRSLTLQSIYPSRQNSAIDSPMGVYTVMNEPWPGWPLGRALAAPEPPAKRPARRTTIAGRPKRCMATPPVSDRAAGTSRRSCRLNIIQHVVYEVNTGLGLRNALISGGILDICL